jgi:hypothetical protein
MHVLFKYMMNVLYTRLILEWQDLYIPYPQWLTRLVMDELYYTLTLLAVCANCFVMGLVIGFIVVVV